MQTDLDTISKIVRDLFDEYEGPISRDLSARDVGQWDSLMNVQFIVLIEEAFAIRFTAREVAHYKNLGDLLDAVAAKRARA